MTHPRDYWIYEIADGATRQVLYVGMTSNVARRVASHRRAKWFPSQPTVNVIGGPYRKLTALYHERKAIRDRKPAHNRPTRYGGKGTPKVIEVHD